MMFVSLTYYALLLSMIVLSDEEMLISIMDKLFELFTIFARGHTEMFLEYR